MVSICCKISKTLARGSIHLHLHADGIEIADNNRYIFLGDSADQSCPIHSTRMKLEVF